MVANRPENSVTLHSIAGSCDKISNAGQFGDAAFYCQRGAQRVGAFLGARTKLTVERVLSRLIPPR
jgi:hypothetical protein